VSIKDFNYLSILGCEFSRICFKMFDKYSPNKFRDIIISFIFLFFFLYFILLFIFLNVNFGKIYAIAILIQKISLIALSFLCIILKINHFIKSSLIILITVHLLIITTSCIWLIRHHLIEL